MRLELSTFRSAAAAGTSSNLLAQWRVGAIVEAVAVRDASDGKLWLNIGATQVPARIASGNAAGPSNGERLQLRVLRNHPVLALETIENTTIEPATVNDGLRRFLPHQASPAPLLANLAWLANNKNGTANRAVQEATQQLWQALPNSKELTTPEGLANAARRSGAFLEANLMQSAPGNEHEILAHDVKSLLINLKQTLERAGASGHTSEQPAPGPLPASRGSLVALHSAAPSLPAINLPTQQLNELAAQTDGALARINTMQLINSEALSTTAPTLLFELPLKRDNHPETIRFRFERNSAQENEAEQSWTVEAALALGASGVMHARVSLYGHSVSVQLRAEPPALVNELVAQLPTLSSILRDSGLEVDRVVCLHGMPPEDRDTRVSNLLDIRV